MKIKLGDIVALKSDSKNTFTVGNFQSIAGEKHAKVYWLDRLTNDLKTMIVPVIELTTEK